MNLFFDFLTRLMLINLDGCLLVFVFIELSNMLLKAMSGRFVSFNGGNIDRGVSDVKKVVTNK